MELYKPTPEELQETLRLHKMWLNNEDGGKRANMSYWDLRSANLCSADLYAADLCSADLCAADLCAANLSSANLCSANLSSADLSSANLSSANLSSANLCSADLYAADLCSADLCAADLYAADLRSANLSSANLSSANLCSADLYAADLCSADLYAADLSSANLSSANLSSAKNLFYPLACPSHGAFTAWKKCRHITEHDNGNTSSVDCIVELLIPADAKRLSATTNKCRCDKAVVVSITGLTEKGKQYDVACSQRDKNFVYKVGKTVSVDDFDNNRWNECSTGIHFFINKEEAERW